MSEQDTTAGHGLTEDEIDVELMLRSKEGDHAAFEQLIIRHQNAVIGTVAKMLGNASDAQDISQQVFLRLWKSAKRYKPRAKFTTYLFTITRNLVFNESAKKARRKTHSLEEQQENSFADPSTADPAKSPDNQLLQQELRNAVDRAIEQLPEKQRLAVILRRYENLPYEDIADITKLSVSAVKSQLFRARNTLRESLAKYLDQ